MLNHMQNEMIKIADAMRAGAYAIEFIEKAELALAYYVREANYLPNDQYWWGAKGYQHMDIAITLVQAIRAIKGEDPDIRSFEWCEEVFAKYKQRNIEGGRHA